MSHPQRAWRCGADKKEPQQIKGPAGKRMRAQQESALRSHPEAEQEKTGAGASTPVPEKIGRMETKVKDQTKGNMRDSKDKSLHNQFYI